MIKKILGIIILIIAILGLLIGIGGIIGGRTAVDAIQQNLSDTLPLIIESLTAAEDSLVLAQDTIGEVNAGLETATQSTINLSKTVGDAAPAVDQIVTITGEDIPQGIEAFQDSIPNLVSVAATIDNTLQTLSDFKIETKILTFPLKFDLGIEYNPEAPFDESLAAIGDSTEGLPQEMRTLSAELATSSGNLEVMSDDILSLAGNLSDINTQLTNIPPLLDRYIDIVNEVEQTVANLNETLDAQFGNLKLGVTILFGWFMLMQLVPLVVGWELLTGGFDRNDDDYEVDPVIAAAPVVAESKAAAYSASDYAPPAPEGVVVEEKGAEMAAVTEPIEEPQPIEESAETAVDEALAALDSADDDLENDALLGA